MGDASFMTERLIGFAIALATGVIVALVGYFLNLNAMKKEGQKRAEEELKSAGYSILSELKTNLEIAQQPFQGRLIPFVASAFGAYASQVARLPRSLQDCIYLAYVEIHKGNAVVNTDLHHLKWGLGYLNTAYKEQATKIIEIAKKATEELAKWLEL